VAKRYGSDISLHRARQVTRHDFQRFSHLVALDLQKLGLAQAMRPAAGAAMTAEGGLISPATRRSSAG